MEASKQLKTVVEVRQAADVWGARWRKRKESKNDETNENKKRGRVDGRSDPLKTAGADAAVVICTRAAPTRTSM